MNENEKKIILNNVLSYISDEFSSYRNLIVNNVNNTELEFLLSENLQITFDNIKDYIIRINKDINICDFRENNFIK